VTPLDKLIGLTLNAMSVLRGGAAFERQMTALLTRTYTAAHLVATAERLGVSVDTLGGLSRAERADITQAVKEQLPYLATFAGVFATLSAAQIAQRLALYAASVRPFYYASRWGGWAIPPTLLPGNQECLGHCLCTISIADNGDGTGTLTRELGATDQSCAECLALAGEHEVKRRNYAAATI